jgi:hypothetical protein
MNAVAKPYNTVHYRGKEYLTRDLFVVDEDGVEYSIVISEDALAGAISPDRTFDDCDEAGEGLDNRIYFYIEDKTAFSLPDRKWGKYCSKHCDLCGLKPVRM